MIVAFLIFLLWLLIYALIAYVAIWGILTIAGLFFGIPPKVAQALYMIAGLIILIWAVEHFPLLAIPSR